MKRVPKIGLPGWKVGENSFGATLAYMNHLSYFGEVRVLTPKKTIDTDLDLIVLPGGKDLSPQLYDQVPGYFNSDADQFKQSFIFWNLKKYIEAGVPVWGTCLGFQELIVFFGGSLIQDIGFSGHESSDPDKRWQPVNELTFTPQYLPLEIELTKGRKPKEKTIKVNSLHHQGVIMPDERKGRKGGTPDCFDVVAYCETNGTGIVEAIRHKTLPIAAGQFHTEEDWNPLGMYLIEELLSKSPNLKNESKRNTAVVAE